MKANGLSREVILKALQEVSEELAKDQTGDVRDIIFLIRHLKLKSAASVLAIVAEYYPADRVPIKAQYLVESLFEEGKV